MVHWTGSKFWHQIKPTTFGNQGADIAGRIREITKVAGTRRAGAHTGGLTIFFGQVFVVNSINAKGAFLHNPLILIHFARAVRAGPSAQSTTDTGVFVDQHDTVSDPFVAGPRGADGDTRRVIAVQAGFGEMDRLRGANVWFDLKGMDAVQEGAGWGCAIWGLIRQRCTITLIIPTFAGSHAGVATDADIKVDD